MIVNRRLFDALVAQAARALPDRYREELQRIAVVVEPRPRRHLGEPPDLLGLFVGPQVGDSDETRAGALPPTIILFQRNLERAAQDRDELFDEIRVTLYHELAHALGFEEDDVADMGLA